MRSVKYLDLLSLCFSLHTATKLNICPKIPLDQNTFFSLWNIKLQTFSRNPNFWNIIRISLQCAFAIPPLQKLLIKTEMPIKHENAFSENSSTQVLKNESKNQKKRA